MTRLLRPCVLGFLLLLMSAGLPQAHAYSVLTHEELIDLAWNDSIRPLLLSRFPDATDAQLREAHAYAYGGCAIQDMGYYPFSQKFFSNLTHYVRTGDFIAWLFRNARTIDEYAFAIGALSHYLGDSIGHSEAINPATAKEFPKLERMYGKSVTYDEGPHAHIRTEFAFDIDELTDRAFAPPAYLRHVGFQVPRKYLEQAFIDTYGFDMHELFQRSRPALRSYRTSVRSVISAVAEAEVVLHRRHFPPHPDNDDYHVFKDRVSRTNYDRHWQHTYKGPGFKAHLLAVFVFLVPKVGAASDLAIKIPTTETEAAYLRSVNRTVDTFRTTLQRLNSEPKWEIRLANIDLDTGHHISRGDYRLADKTYADLLKRLTSNPERTIPIDVQQNIIRFYSATKLPINPQSGIEPQLAILKGMKTADGLTPMPEPPEPGTSEP